MVDRCGHWPNEDGSSQAVAGVGIMNMVIQPAPPTQILVGNMGAEDHR